MHANANVTLPRLHDLEAGESYIYHVGDLGFDRQQDRELELIGTETWKQYIAGKLLLTCRRLESFKAGVFRGEYIATRRKTITPVVWRGGK